MAMTRELKSLITQKYNEKAKEKRENNQKELNKVFGKELKEFEKIQKKITELQNKQQDIRNIIRQTDSRYSLNGSVGHYYIYDTQASSILNKSLNEILVQLQYTNADDILAQIEEIFNNLR